MGRYIANTKAIELVIKLPISWETHLTVGDNPVPEYSIEQMDGYTQVELVSSLSIDLDARFSLKVKTATEAI